MKTNVKIASFALVMGMAAALTSCHRGDSIDVEQKVEMNLNQTNTLQVKFTSSVSGATVTYAGVTAKQSGNLYTVSNAAASGKVNVTLPTAYVAVAPIDVTFGTRKTVVISVTPVKKSTLTKTQTAMGAGGTINNDTQNQNTSKVGASLKLNPGVNPTYSGTDPYSLTVFTEPQEPVKEVEEQQVYPAQPYTVACEPDGTSFDGQGAHLELQIGGIGEIGVIGANGIEFKHEGNTKVVNALNIKDGDILAADVPGFSNWNVVVNAKCTEIKTENVVIATGNLPEGAQTVSYKEKFGFTSKDATSQILKMWMQLLFGATSTTVEKTATINMERSGMYTIYQEYIEMTFVAGNKTFHVTTYGKILPATIVYTSEPVKTHVGGSN